MSNDKMPLHLVANFIPIPCPSLGMQRRLLPAEVQLPRAEHQQHLGHLPLPPRPAVRLRQQAVLAQHLPVQVPAVADLPARGVPATALPSLPMSGGARVPGWELRAEVRR